MSYQVSVANHNEAEELVKLVNSAYRGESAQAGWTNESHLLGGLRITNEALAAEISSERKKILVVREAASSPILATVNLEWVEDEETKRPGCYLGMLTVNPNLQTRGMGKFLMKAAEDFVKHADRDFIILGVIHTREELISWYERRGYVKTGLTKPFPYDEGFAKDAKRFDLFFVFLQKDL